MKEPLYLININFAAYRAGTGNENDAIKFGRKLLRFLDNAQLTRHRRQIKKISLRGWVLTEYNVSIGLLKFGEMLTVEKLDYE